MTKGAAVPEEVTASRNDSRMVVLSGKVSTLYVTDGTANLLKGMQGKMLATGMGAAIQDMAGSVANAAMISMYDGENVQHFGCYIGEQMMIGTFEHIGFNEGDEVKAVATKLDDKVAFSHAVVRVDNGLVWMPRSISKGRFAIAIWIAKLLCWIGLFGLTFLSVLEHFIGAFDHYVNFLLVMGAGLIATGGILGFLTYMSSVADGLYAERILKALGFKNPKIVNLSPFSQARLGIGSSYMVYDLRRALKAYNSLSKVAPPINK